MPLFLGIDIGTSATKAVLCDEVGVVVAAASSPHTISRPHPGWSEQDPQIWFDAAIAAIQQVLATDKVHPETIAAVGLSGQMHGSVFLPPDATAHDGSKAAAIRPALLWNDQRTSEQCIQIEQAAGGRAQLVQLVGNAALTGFTLPKILWLRDHEPENFAKTASVILPKDYIRLRLTGRIATDFGDAAGTLLLDIQKRIWSQEAIAMARIDQDLLPPLLESSTVAGSITQWAASQTGLKAGTPVVTGSGDNQAGAVGAGVVSPGRVLATLGTSGVIYAHASKPQLDISNDTPPGRVHTMCAPTGSENGPGQWCITGCMLAAAGSLQWLRDTLFPSASFDELVAQAATAPPGSDGLVFLPHLTGERCPYPDPNARAGWIGLTSRHTRAHMIRSVLEGVTFTMAQILDIVRQIGVPVRAARLGGGGAKSELWRQMQADIYNIPVSLPNTQEGPAYGAAILAAVGAGAFPNIQDACDSLITDIETREPNTKIADRYAPVRDVHARMYDDLKDRFAALAAAEASFAPTHQGNTGKTQQSQ